MTTPWRRLVAATTLTLAGLAVAGCSGSTPHDATYTFNQRDSTIQVDSPALRALKESAHIAGCPSSGAAAGHVDGGLPSLTLPCLGGGRAVDLASLRGPLLVNFWAQTCGPCRAESPLLQKLSTQAAGAVRVVGVDFLDARPGLALGFAKRLGLTYPQIADPVGSAKAPLGIAGLPYTFFIDASGSVVYTQTGPMTSAHELASLVTEHLGVTVPGLAGS